MHEQRPPDGPELQPLCRRPQRSGGHALSISTGANRRSLSGLVYLVGGPVAAVPPGHQRHRLPQREGRRREHRRAGGPGGLGVALSHPELSAWSTDWRPKLTDLKSPVKKLPFADAGLIGNPLERNPDNWVEVRKQQSLYWRVPTNRGWYNDDPQRPIGRHVNRCLAGFADGHSEALKVSAIGLQFFPGKTSDGKSATGLQWLGGNGRYDERWRWSWGSE